MGPKVKCFHHSRSAYLTIPVHPVIGCSLLLNIHRPVASVDDDLFRIRVSMCSLKPYFMNVDLVDVNVNHWIKVSLSLLTEGQDPPSVEHGNCYQLLAAEINQQMKSDSLCLFLFK